MQRVALALVLAGYFTSTWSEDKLEVSSSSPCLAERERVIRQSQDASAASRRKQPASLSAAGAGIGASVVPSKILVIPECKADGTYQEVQCHAATKYCWCVNPEDGKHIPKSSVANARPSCGKSKADDRQADDCVDAQKKEFNTNLVKLFLEEYMRLPEETRKLLEAAYDGTTSDPLLEMQGRIVLEWKFGDLDKNKDKELQAVETRNLKKIVRNNVRPKECAKDFTERCDKNQDTQISRNEWSLCLGGDIEHTPLAQGGWDGEVLPIRDTQVIQDSDNGRSPPELYAQQRRLHDMLEQMPTSVSGGSSLFDQDGGEDMADLVNVEVTKPLEEMDRRRMRANSNQLISLHRKTCTEERTNSLRNQDGDTAKHVPVCQDNGKFQKDQCHISTGYCWCVDEETGMLAQGTVVLKARPNCSSSDSDLTDEEEDASPAIIHDQGVGSRELPGCPNKRAFLTQLIDALTREMVDGGGKLPSSITDDPSISIEEKAVRWKVFKIDKNVNDHIDKKEMKEFNKVLNSKKIKSPKKCSKNFVNYCDADVDTRLSIAELLECTGVKVQPAGSRSTPQASGDNGSGRGRSPDVPQEKQNPFIYLLKPSNRK